MAMTNAGIMVEKPYKPKLPHVNKIGGELLAEGLVFFGKKAYNQYCSNCFEIASHIARRFGYVPPQSHRELIGQIIAAENYRFWGGPKPFRQDFEACLVVRSPDKVSDVHVAFEVSGKEYNYGPGRREGYDVDICIPLQRNSNKKVQGNLIGFGSA